MIKKILTSSLIYAIGPQLPRIIGLFLLPVLTPFLSQVDFGVFGTVTAYNLLFSSARDLGLVVPMFNSYYNHPSRWVWVWRQIVWYLLIWGIICAILQALLLYFVIPSVATDNKPTIIGLLALQCIFFDVPNLIGARYFQVAEKPLSATIVSVLSGFVAIGAQYYFIVLKHYGYMGWIYATFLSLGISAIIFVVLLYKLGIVPLPVFRRRWAYRRLKIALPMLPHNYSAYLLNASDRAMLAAYKTPVSQIGTYNLAYMWGNYMDILGYAVGNAVGPIYLKLYKNNKDEFVMVKQLTRFLQAIFIVGSFTVAVWSKELFQIFIRNKSFTGAYSLAVIIIMSYSYRPMYWQAQSKLQYEEKTSKLWLISFIAGVINISLNAIFIPLYGFQAAAYTTFAAMMYQGFAGFLINTTNRGFFKSTELLTWFLSIVLFSMIAYLIKDVSLYTKAIVSAVAAVFIIVILNKFSKLLTFSQ